MQYGFYLLAGIVAMISSFFDIRVTLGILLALIGIFLISIARKQFEYRVNHAEKFNKGLIFSHLFMVIGIMVVILTIAFFFQKYLSPVTTALVFVANRFYMYLTMNFTRPSNNV